MSVLSNLCFEAWLCTTDTSCSYADSSRRPFHRVGVDVLSLPSTSKDNRYAVVFVDYLRKWPEVFVVADHTGETIPPLLAESVICRHSVPKELFSYRGVDFLSELVKEVCKLTNIKKIHTSEYHPQTDGIVKRLNWTLINMMAKHAQFHGPNWDKYLTYLLFAYRVRLHSSTSKSPFFLQYERDTWIPTETVLEQPSLSQLQKEDYKTDMTEFSMAWEKVIQRVEKAQIQYKSYYNWEA